MATRNARPIQATVFDRQIPTIRGDFCATQYAAAEASRITTAASGALGVRRVIARRGVGGDLDQALQKAQLFVKVPIATSVPGQPQPTGRSRTEIVP